MKWVLRIAGGLVLAWMVIGAFALVTALMVSKAVTSTVEEQTRPVTTVFDQLVPVAPTPLTIPLTKADIERQKRTQQMVDTRAKCDELDGVVYYDMDKLEHYCKVNGVRQ